MNVRWTESALADLGAIEAYIGRHSVQYARGMVERIFSRSAQLTDHPRLGPVVPEYDDPNLRELLVSPYRMVYRPIGDRIDIVAVVHASRQMPRGL